MWQQNYVIEDKLFNGKYQRQSQEGAEEQNAGQTYVTISVRTHPSAGFERKWVMPFLGEKAISYMMPDLIPKTTVRKTCRHLLFILDLQDHVQWL